MLSFPLDSDESAPLYSGENRPSFDSGKVSMEYNDATSSDLPVYPPSLQSTRREGSIHNWGKRSVTYTFEPRFPVMEERQHVLGVLGRDKQVCLILHDLLLSLSDTVMKTQFALAVEESPRDTIQIRWSR